MLRRERRKCLLAVYVIDASAVLRKVSGDAFIRFGDCFRRACGAAERQDDRKQVATMTGTTRKLFTGNTLFLSRMTETAGTALRVVEFLR